MEIPTRIYPSRKPDPCIILDSGNSITHPSLPTENESQTAVDLVYSLGPVQSYTWSRLMNAGLSPFQVLAQFPPGLRSDSEVPDCRNAPSTDFRWKVLLGQRCNVNGHPARLRVRTARPLRGGTADGTGRQETVHPPTHPAFLPLPEPWKPLVVIANVFYHAIGELCSPENVGSRSWCHKR